MASVPLDPGEERGRVSMFQSAKRANGKQHHVLSQTLSGVFPKLQIKCGPAHYWVSPSIVVCVDYQFRGRANDPRGRCLTKTSRG